MTLARHRDHGGGCSPPPVTRLLRDRRWAPVAVGSATALMGFWVYSIVGAVLVYQLTERTLLVGVFTALQFGANLIVSPFVGVVLERVGLRAGMIASTVAVFGSGAALSAAVVTGQLTAGVLFAATAVTGIASAVTTPGLQSLMPRALAMHEVPTAVVVQSGAITLARAVGPAIAGGFLAVNGYAAGFAFHAVAHLAYALGVALTPTRATETATPGSLRRAWNYVFTDPATLVLLGATLLVAWGTDPVNTLLPALADRLGGGESLVGALASAFGAGALFAAVIFRRISSILAQAQLSGGGLALLGVALVTVAVAPTPIGAGGVLVLGGAGFVTALTSITARLQAHVEPAHRAHVMGLWSAAFIGGRLPASLTNGALADATGVGVATVVVGAVLTIAGLVAVRLLAED